jgi:hypothetical protein
VRSRTGAAKTILRFLTLKVRKSRISNRPTKQALMIRTFLIVHGVGLHFFVSA